jgi:hypothetical protein
MSELEPFSFDHLARWVEDMEARSGYTPLAYYVPDDAYKQALHELCRWYLGATARQRSAVRSALSGHKGLLNHLLGYVYTAIERARGTGKVSWLQIGFAAASIQNNRLDPRDYALAWDALAGVTREMGLDPEVAFRAAHYGDAPPQ